MMEALNEEYENPDIRSYLVDMKTTKVSELVRENEDGTHTILLNSRFNYERNLMSYQHALSHILREDFLEYNVQEIEAEAHSAS